METRTRKQYEMVIPCLLMVLLCGYSLHAEDITTSDRPTKKHSWHAHEREITSLSLSPNNKLLLSTSLGGTAKIWRLPAGKLVHEIPTQAHKVLAGAFVDNDLVMTNQQSSPDPQKMVHQTLNIWQISRDDVQLRFKVDVPRYNPWLGKSMPNGDAVIAPDGSDKIVVWAVGANHKMHRKSTLKLPAGQATAIGVSPNGDVIGIGSDEGKIYLFRQRDGALIATLTHSRAGVYCVAFTGSNTLFSAGTGNPIVKWNWKRKRRLATVMVPGHARIRDLAPITKGNGVYAAVNRVKRTNGAKLTAWGTVQLWNLSTGKQIDTHKVNAIWVDNVIYDSAIPAVIAGDSSGNIHVWPARGVVEPKRPHSEGR